MVFDFLKKKKPEQKGYDSSFPGSENAGYSQNSETPVDFVISMQSQGLTNNQIIQTLQRQGFSQQQIYDALAQADAKKGVEAMMPETTSEQQTPQQQETFNPSEFNKNFSTQDFQQIPQQQDFQQQNIPENTRFTQQNKPEMFEELAEQIVEEKWKTVQKEITKISEWKSEITTRIDKMEQSIIDLKGNFDGLHKAIVSRIGDYDKTLLDVGTEIKAMEKVFEKVLPELTNNVQELSRLAKKGKNIEEKSTEKTEDIKKPTQKKSVLESKI